MQNAIKKEKQIKIFKLFVLLVRYFRIVFANSPASTGGSIEFLSHARSLSIVLIATLSYCVRRTFYAFLFYGFWFRSNSFIYFASFSLFFASLLLSSLSLSVNSIQFEAPDERIYDLIKRLPTHISGTFSPRFIRFVQRQLVGTSTGEAAILWPSARIYGPNR